MGGGKSSLGTLFLVLVLGVVGYMAAAKLFPELGLPLPSGGVSREDELRRQQIIAEAKADRDRALKRAREEKRWALQRLPLDQMSDALLPRAVGVDAKTFDPAAGRRQIIADYERRVRDIEDAYNRRVTEADKLLRR